VTFNELNSCPSNLLVSKLFQKLFQNLGGARLYFIDFANLESLKKKDFQLLGIFEKSFKAKGNVQKLKLKKSSFAPTSVFPP